MIALVCEANMSMNQVIAARVRRLLRRAYPTDSRPPNSGSTVTRFLLEDAAQVRCQIQGTLQRVREKGSNFYCSPTLYVDIADREFVELMKYRLDFQDTSSLCPSTKRRLSAWIGT